MTTASRTPDTLASHAVCVAAGARDGLRTAQFFMRELAGAERWGRSTTQPADARAGWAPSPGAFLSSLVSCLARLADRVMTWSVNTLIALLAPGWRTLPSPFTQGMMDEVSAAITARSFVVNPLFNAYFYRATVHILRRYSSPPLLVLEHRVDAARRALAAAPNPKGTESDTVFLARALIALVRSAPVARAGTIRRPSILADTGDPNVGVCAVACVALLFAEDGRPAEDLDEDQFFAVVGALILPRLAAIATLVAEGDAEGLASELADVKAMY